MADAYTEASLLYTQTQRDIAAELILAGEAEPEAAMGRAKLLTLARLKAKHDHKKRANLTVVE